MRRKKQDTLGVACTKPVKLTTGFSFWVCFREWRSQSVGVCLCWAVMVAIQFKRAFEEKDLFEVHASLIWPLVNWVL